MSSYKVSTRSRLLGLKLKTMGFRHERRKPPVIPSNLELQNTRLRSRGAERKGAWGNSALSYKRLQINRMLGLQRAAKG